MRTEALSHVAMSVPPGTLTDEYRAAVLAFYGELFGWREIESLRRPDRLTIAVGSFAYINVRERSESMRSTGYEHFGILVRSADELDRVRTTLSTRYPEIDVEDQSPTEGGHPTFRFRHLLPLAVEVQYFSDVS